MSAKLRDKYMPFVFMDLSGPVAVSGSDKVAIWFKLRLNINVFRQP